MKSYKAYQYFCTDMPVSSSYSVITSALILPCKFADLFGLLAQNSKDLLIFFLTAPRFFASSYLWNFFLTYIYLAITWVNMLPEVVNLIRIYHFNSATLIHISLLQVPFKTNPTSNKGTIWWFVQDKFLMVLMFSRIVIKKIPLFTNNASILYLLVKSNIILYLFRKSVHADDII